MGRWSWSLWRARHHRWSLGSRRAGRSNIALDGLRRWCMCAHLFRRWNGVSGNGRDGTVSPRAGLWEGAWNTRASRRRRWCWSRALDALNDRDGLTGKYRYRVRVGIGVAMARSRLSHISNDSTHNANTGNLTSGDCTNTHNTISDNMHPFATPSVDESKRGGGERATLW